MKVHFGIDEFETRQNIALTIGTFDGVHLGHKIVLQNLIKQAKKINGESVLLTFHPHPRLVLYPENNDLKMLNTQEEKIELLDKTGIDHLIIHPFTREFSRLSSTEFVRDILVNKLNTKVLITGHDHHFGRNREGSFQELNELATLYSFELEKQPALEIESINVSSTKVRTAIQEGDIGKANTFLGYHYQLMGEVVEGDQLGRTLGFPTANIFVKNHHKLIPPVGAYAVYVFRNNDKFKGMLNIGKRPTIHNVSKKTIEVNIFDFDNTIYGENIVVEFVEKIRDEKKFDDVHLLQKQLEIDKNKCLNLL
ncbi:MAG: bifunctional riboflavin kinase/FAD synthetase [Flavobacteriales bacterium]|nr:bifunctional riboflavin kinase/FAD synthetase [Flavobacteriales bacterium]